MLRIRKSLIRPLLSNFNNRSIHALNLVNKDREIRDILIVVFPNIGDIIAYKHGLHSCQEVYPYRNQ